MEKKKKKLPKLMQNPMDFVLFVTIILLFSIGVIMVLSASSPTALSEGGDSYSYFKKQIIIGGFGIVSMLIISNLDYRAYQKYYKWGLIGSILLCLLVVLIGKEVNGAKRWIDLGDAFSFQPSEIVKILMIIFYAGILTKNKKNLHKLFKGMLYHLLFIIPPLAFLVVHQSHMSATVLITSVVIVMIIVAGCKFRQMLILGVCGVLPLGAYLVIREPYRLARVTTFVDPWSDPTGSGWQIIQSLYAIGSGGLFGVGLGESKQKYSYIPEAHNDFIFSIIGEELGFIGSSIVIILFLVFIWRGVLVAIKAPDMFGSLLAIGITTLIAVQVIINIAVVTSSMPVTGMPLPFFSYGGTSLFILLSTMGILLNISRASAKT